MQEHDEVGLMRYQLISPLLDPDLKRGERGILLGNLAKKWLDHPNTGKKVNFKAETIRHWVKSKRSPMYLLLSLKIY